MVSIFSGLGIAVDIYKGLVGAGSSSSSAAKTVLGYGEKFKNTWGGSVDFSTRTIYTQAKINYKTGNDSHEIVDSNTRYTFIKLVRSYFGI